MRKLVVLLLAVMLSAGCATNVRFIDVASEQESVDDESINLFYDAFGSLYPKDGLEDLVWLNHEDNYSVFGVMLDNTIDCDKHTDSPEMMQLCQAVNGTFFENYEQHQIAQKSLIASRADHIYEQLDEGRELIVLIHGYNNNYFEAKKNFNRMKLEVRQYAKGSERKFLFLQVYWDGFKGNPVSGAWSKAQSSGPLVGFKMRLLFNALTENFSDDEEPSITFISHSSGAFVLGALFGNPISALPDLETPESLYYQTFKDNRCGQGSHEYSIPTFNSITLGMIAAATPTTTFNGVDTIGECENRAGLLADNVKMVFSMNKYDFALSKVFSLEEFSIFGATTSGSNKDSYCKYINVLTHQNKNIQTSAIHFEKEDTPFYWPINNHALIKDGYFHRQESKELFFNAVLNDDYSDPHNKLVTCTFN